ncbi:MAG: hypothetical protein ABH821_01465 [archaeon]
MPGTLKVLGEKKMYKMCPSCGASFIVKDNSVFCSEKCKSKSSFLEAKFTGVKNKQSVNTAYNSYFKGSNSSDGSSEIMRAQARK